MCTSTCLGICFANAGKLEANRGLETEKGNRKRIRSPTSHFLQPRLARRRLAISENLCYRLYMHTPDIREKINSSIMEIDSTIDIDKITTPFKKTIKEINSVYGDLSVISRKRDTYNNAWAFSYAYEQMHLIIDHLFSVKVTEKIFSYSRSFRNRKKQTDILKKFHTITSNLSDILHKTSTSQRLFKTTIWLIALAEGVVSLVIVLFITETASAFNRAVSLPQLSLLFLIVFGSLRLLLERLKSRIMQNWRWTRYQATVDRAFNSIAIAAGISCILAEHVKKGTFLEKIDDLLEKGVDLLKRPDTREEKTIRRAAHRSARLLAGQEEKLGGLRRSLSQKNALYLAIYRKKPIKKDIQIIQESNEKRLFWDRVRSRINKGL